MRHATYPVVCEQCRRDITTMAEHSQGKLLVSFCDHQPEGVALVTCMTNSMGEVMRWMIDAPMSFEDAQRRAALTATLVPQAPEIERVN